jgi:hypothetical protein
VLSICSLMSTNKIYTANSRVKAPS